MKTPCTLEHVRGTGSLWTPMAWPCQLLSLPDRRSSCSCGTTAQPRRQCSRAKLQLLQQLPAPAPDRLCVLDPTLRNILPQARNVNIALCMPMSSLLTQQESGTYPAAAIFHDREPLACGRSAIQSQPDTCYRCCACRGRTAAAFWGQALRAASTWRCCASCRSHKALLLQLTTNFCKSQANRSSLCRAM